MKFLMALTLLTSVNAFAGYAPVYQVEVDDDNIVTLTAENDSDRNLECSYSISWLENVWSYKKFYGKFSFAPGEIVVVTKNNDPYSRISRVHGTVSCQ